MEKAYITIEATVNAPIEKVWEYWTLPKHITQWNQASDDWHSPSAENDLRVGGSFSTRMEAKDGSFGFDFGGVYETVNIHAQIAYVLGDGRTVSIDFDSQGEQIHIKETFEAETQNAAELQKNGWQAILNSFKKYTEEH